MDQQLLWPCELKALSGSVPSVVLAGAWTSPCHWSFECSWAEVESRAAANRWRCSTSCQPGLFSLFILYTVWVSLTSGSTHLFPDQERWLLEFQPEGTWAGLLSAPNYPNEWSWGSRNVVSLRLWSWPSAPSDWLDFSPSSFLILTAAASRNTCLKCQEWLEPFVRYVIQQRQCGMVNLITFFKKWISTSADFVCFIVHFEFSNSL